MVVCYKRYIDSRLRAVGCGEFCRSHQVAGPFGVYYARACTRRAPLRNCDLSLLLREGLLQPGRCFRLMKDSAGCSNALGMA